MNTQAIVQLLILLDQITAQVVNLINSIKGASEADEAQLRKLIVEQRIKNDAAYVAVIDKLKTRITE